MECKICKNTDTLKEYKVREMMFGFRDEFSYLECEKCGCLQIAEIPVNISKYYPSNYYSYSTPTSQIKSKLFEIFKRKRDHYEIFKEGIYSIHLGFREHKISWSNY